MEIGDILNGVVFDHWHNGMVVSVDDHEETVLFWYTGNGFRHFVVTVEFVDCFGEKVADAHVYEQLREGERYTDMLQLIYTDELGTRFGISEVIAEYDNR